MVVEFVSPGHGYVLDTWISYGISYLLRGGAELIPLDTAYLFKVEKAPNWNALKQDLIAEIERIVQEYDDVALKLEGLRGAEHEEREAILDSLRELRKLPGGRLFLALRTQGTVNAQKAIENIKKAVENLKELSFDLSSVYDPAHAIRYREGRGGLAKSLKRSVKIKSERISLFNAPLPIVATTGKYATSLYSYKAAQEKVCPYDLLLAYLGLSHFGIVISERDQATSIVLLRPAVNMNLDD
ncbi:MAG: hypothetical protein DRO00_10360, partial [Thermoproteota archaeon]